jgi:hypothetical protein
MALFRNRLVVLAALLVTLSCVNALPPVQLEGPRRNFGELVGKWTGTYTTDGIDGPRGSIYFALVAGEDHAHGNVLMIPTGTRRVPGDREPRDIHFVRSTGGQVSGAMDPSWDAVRDCWKWTVFRGEIKDGAIVGTFRTTYARPFSDTTGRWRVDRSR